MQADDETRDFGINEWMDVSSFQNSWVNYGGTSANAAYCKDSNAWFIYEAG